MEGEQPLPFTGLSETEREKVKTVINRLLAVNFLVKEKDREAYMLIRRHFEEIKSFFQFLDWEIVLDDRHECVFVYAPERRFRQNLDKEQSIWLLIIRLVYQEKRQEISLSEFPMTTIYEIKSKYDTFRFSWLNRTTLERFIKWCTRMQLMEALDADMRSDDCRFRLFHTWQYVIEADQVQVMQDKIGRYAKGEEEGFIDEAVEEHATD